MSDNLNKFRDLMVQSAGEFAASLGLNRILGQLYALLYFSPHSISLDEMGEALKMSKGNISVNIRILEKWDAVRKVWVKGSRKDYYQADPDILEIVFNRLQIGLSRRLDQVSGIIKVAENLIHKAEKNTNKNKVSFYQKRLKKIQNSYNLVKSILVTISKQNLISLLKMGN